MSVWNGLPAMESHAWLAVLYNFIIICAMHLTSHLLWQINSSPEFNRWLGPIQKGDLHWLSSVGESQYEMCMFRNVCMCISPDRQPASRICLLQDSCHGRKRIVVGIADAQCPQGWTGDRHNSSSRCFLSWESQAITDGRTRYLEKEKFEK